LGKVEFLQKAVQRAEGILSKVTSITTPILENGFIGTNSNKVFAQPGKRKTAGELFKDYLALKWSDMTKDPVVRRRLSVESGSQIRTTE